MKSVGNLGVVEPKIEINLKSKMNLKSFFMNELLLSVATNNYNPRIR